MALFGSLVHDNRSILAPVGVVGVGVIALFVLGRTTLRVWRDEAEIKPAQPKTQYITQETEDSLQLGTLDTLLNHYNFQIRETTAKIICDRAANDPSTLEVLLWGITRPDYDERMMNLRALAMITDQNTLKHLHRYKAYTALVRSLELSLDPDQQPLDDPNFDEYPLRDMSEKLCLMFISQLIGHYKPDKLIKAKFVERWLAKQNWGPKESQLDNFVMYRHLKSNRITDIVQIIRETPLGQEALIAAGLELRDHHRRLSTIDKDMEDATERYSLLVSLQVGRARSVEQSAEEQRLRHRHREAMVLNDGTRPFNSDDIIQRDLGSPP
ncbi:hypothetical protein B0H66DRAFT_33775 [Apodospora peruviana]|uniref:Cytoskeleton-associated protein n=1 Tax=Apodospora peruviana TaxID=516989 RepID=A0AAE0IQX4_9PEZI|nr:hypothetical protein B0H66DRAFT_33775 [Apodospora peruviana]